MSVFDKYRCEGQMSIFDLGLWSGKTSPEHSVPTAAKTSGQYSKKFAELRIKMPLFLNLRGGAGNGQQAGASWDQESTEYIAWLGGYTMRSFGECPSEERGSRLSQILEETPHPKYCLSAKACAGILRRAERRGKELPEILKKALIRQAKGITEAKEVELMNSQNGIVKPFPSRNEPDVRGARESSFSTNEQEPCQHSITNVYCLQGNGIDRADTAGCNGKGWREDQSYTLNTIDRPAVCASQQAIGEYKIGGGGIQPETERLQGCNGFGDTVGALCAGDSKQVGNQIVNQGKIIIQRIE